MSIEYEVKIISSIGDPLEYIHMHGEVMHPRQRMQRAVFTLQHNEPVKQWIRVRDEGQKVTLTLKKDTGTNKLDSVHEWELVVDNFEKACQFVEQLGYIKTWTAQTYRKAWQFKDCMVTCDEWPGLPPFLEVEGTTAHDVRHVLQVLQISEADCWYGNIFSVYKKLYNIPESAFADFPSITEDVVEQLKNKCLLKKA